MDNIASGEDSSVSGGEGNTASGEDSSVSGGNGNTASGNRSSVSGGEGNTASGYASSVSGGEGNTASGKDSSVSGGNGNTASGEWSSVSGGFKNKASGYWSSVSGGYYNEASGVDSSVSGGYRNTASGYASSVSGGDGNTASGSYSSVSGGMDNIASGEDSSVSGGHFSKALGEESWAAGGATAYGQRSNAIGNGAVNTYKGNKDTAEKSMAIGYEATADTAGTISFGHDAGDASGYQVKWHKRTDGQRNPDGTYNDYTQAPESITETHYDSARYNRLVKVADGVDDHDVVVMEQLKPYVKTDALSKVKTHFYSVNSTDAAKGNYNNDGAEGTDSLAAGVNALAKGADSVAVGVNATARNNAIAVGNSAKAGNTGIALGMNAHAGYGQNMALGYYASVADGVRNSTALGYGSQVTQRDILTSDGSDGVISVGRAVGQSGEKGMTRRIINVKAGVKGTDAAAVSQLTELKAGDHVTITDGAELNDKGQTVKTISAVADGKIAKGDTGLLSGGAVYSEVHVDSDGNYIRSGNTVAGNLEALDGKVKTNADNIEKNGLAIEKNTADIKTNADNIEKNGKAIEQNSAAIKTNSDNIEKVSKTVEQNSAAIKTNADNIEKVSKTVEQNSAAIKTNADNIEKNGKAIEKNSAAIKTNADNIEKNGKAIEKNSAAIKTNAGNIEKISKTVEQTSARVATNSSNIEKNGKAIEKNSAAIKTNAGNIEKNGRDIETLQQTKADISLSNINDAGKTVINNLAKKSIDVKAGSSNVTVTTNDVTDGVKTFTVDMAKDISVDSVAAKDVKADSLTVNKEATIGGVTIKDSKVTGLADTSIEKGSTSAVNADTVYNETRVANDGHYIKAANTAGANITALDNQVAANAGNIFNLDNRVGELGSRINKVGAGAAALAALHPLDFDPSDKWDFAAGVGNYRNETAAAVGLFYRPNARSMFNLGWTMGDNRNMVNGGFSIKLGKGSVYNDMSKAQMAETIATQSKEISAMKADNAAIKADYDALKADNEAKEKRIDALEKQMQEIMAKLGK